MPTTWVDFKAVKEAVSMEMVLSRYGIGLRKAGNQILRGRCPLPQHTSKESALSFTVTLNKGTGGVWACQSDSCAKARGAKGGNVLDFVAAMEQCTVREAAERLQNWFLVGSGSAPPLRPETRPREQALPKDDRPGAGAQPNKPLAFTLQGVDPHHSYLVERGLTPDSTSLFGVGFFPGKGSMAGRVVIPIQNELGELVAYAGRAIDGSEPKYKFPTGFLKGQVVFNLKRTAGVAHRVLVEGFFDCFILFQAGYRAISLMGSTLTEDQERLLIREVPSGTKLTLMFDGDEAGRKATSDILPRLSRHFFVRVIDLSDGKQPDQLSKEDLLALLGEP